MPELVITDDGSSSLYLKELDEHYHSRHGAVTESRHVFIEAGFRSLERDPVSIFEMGFGTGLNAFLTLVEAIESGRTVHFTGIEKFPLKDDLISRLNYPDGYPENYGNAFRQLHAGPWNEWFSPSEKFHLKKIRSDIADWPVAGPFDLVYYDAFAPAKQPELWTPEIFTRIYEMLTNEGILTTYAVKGDVKRALVSAGFKIEKLPGPPGKREMLRARKVL
jgi:tRNA U34 5-methylaminomethyl-2-thiouridine-forming methyltransferase MnmC